MERDRQPADALELGCEHVLGDPAEARERGEQALLDRVDPMIALGRRLAARRSRPLRFRGGWMREDERREDWPKEQGEDETARASLVALALRSDHPRDRDDCPKDQI